MDDQSGKIYRFNDEETMKIFKERLNQVGHSLTELQKEPDPNCSNCQGRGSIPSKPYTKDGHICFFRLCKCTTKED